MWRARLRLFLCPGGELAEKHAFELCVGGIEMCQTAVNLTGESIRRRHEFCAVFDGGLGASHRTACSPHFVTSAEKAHFETNARRTVQSLRAEFSTLLGQLPDEVTAADLCSSFEVAKTKEAVLVLV